MAVTPTSQMGETIGSTPYTVIKFGFTMYSILLLLLLLLLFIIFVGENCIMRSLMACIPYPILCGW
jgi:hypothetical protein